MPFDSLRSLGARTLLVNQLPKGPYYGILAEFATPADLYHACERVRDAGFTRWDAHSPFPVHGLAGWGSDAARFPGSSSALLERTSPI